MRIRISRFPENYLRRTELGSHCCSLLALGPSGRCSSAKRGWGERSETIRGVQKPASAPPRTRPRASPWPRPPPRLRPQAVLRLQSLHRSGASPEPELEILRPGGAEQPYGAVTPLGGGGGRALACYWLAAEGGAGSRPAIGRRSEAGSDPDLRLAGGRPWRRARRGDGDRGA